MADAPPIIIIAEPDRMISSALRVEFSQSEFAVLLAADGREAEDFAAQTIAALVILDVGRLRLEGYTACARIRRRPGYAARPIVLTAGDVTSRDHQAASTAGATGVLAKPYSLADLVRIVTPHLLGDDPLLTHRAIRSGLAAASREWKGPSGPLYVSSDNSGLARNGQLLPIVRSQGIRIPVHKMT
jgi:DNA-binding response OmpR family regulator